MVLVRKKKLLISGDGRKSMKTYYLNHDCTWLHRLNIKPSVLMAGNLPSCLAVNSAVKPNKNHPVAETRN